MRDLLHLVLLAVPLAASACLALSACAGRDPEPGYGLTGEPALLSRDRLDHDLRRDEAARDRDEEEHRMDRRDDRLSRDVREHGDSGRR